MSESKVKDYSLSSGEVLLDFWYPALLSRQLKRGQMRRQMLLNTPLLVCRDGAGVPFVLDDHCPHRGMPLSYGRFDGECVECCYHGWQFDREGQCRHIPALLPDSPVKVERIRAKSFLCVEADGLIWVFIPARLARAGALPDIPLLPVFSERYRVSVISRRLLCKVDHGIIGLMDPAHGPFVHRAWWWRSRSSIHAKAKTYEPIPNGFRMSAHTPSGNSAAYKLLKLYDEPVTTTIDFVLPNVRYEQVRCGPYWFSSRTTVTPITDEECRLDFVAAWNVFSRVPFIKQIFRIFANLFIGQDQKIMEMQAVGLKDNPSLLLIDDADTPARWYYRLKDAYLEAQRTGNAISHPIKAPVTLRWRS